MSESIRDSRINYKLAAIVLGIGAAINPLNSSLVVTSFADIAGDFGISFSEVSVMMTYYLAFTAAFYPIAGAIGDLLGRKRVFIFGIVGFGVVSLIASISSSFTVLLMCRCLQALFSAALMPNASALLREIVPEEKLASSIGIMSVIVGTATALGFPLGGLLSQYFGWRPLFLINVPLSLLACGIALFLLPKSTKVRARFSLAAFFGVPLLPLALGVNFLLNPESHNPLTANFLLLICGLTVAGLLLVLYRSQNLRRDVLLFSNRGFNTSVAIAAFYSIVLYSIFLVLPTWLVYGVGVEKQIAGLFLGVITFSLAFAAPFAGRFVDRYGEKSCLIFSSFLMALALGLFWQLQDASIGIISVAAILLGFSFTGVGNAGQSMALKWVPEEVTAMAMGLYTCGRYLGGLVGTTAVGYFLSVQPHVDLEAGKFLFEAMCVGGIIPLLLISFISPKVPVKSA